VGHVVEAVDPAGIDRVEPLWLAMVEHHRAVSAGDLKVREPAETWRRRRADYAGWLRSGTGFILVAVHEPGGEPDGYAAVRVHDGSATFDLGARVGELESLAVAERARGAGVGRLLIGAARERLRAGGVENWTIAVLDANPAARRLYEREGFRPYYSQMVAPIE
jgi:ribosomal protein S18 acetylase RimI-like enzyme